jgi:hypothetical protein
MQDELSLEIERLTVLALELITIINTLKRNHEHLLATIGVQSDSD